MVEQTWAPAICDLMETLTCRVRLLTLAHIRQGWAAQFSTIGGVVTAIERLVAAGLVVGDVWDVPASPIGEKPLAVWEPQRASPDLVQLADIIQARWTEPSSPTPVVAATQKAAVLFGSSAGGLPPMNHRNHDLLLAAVYIHYRTKNPELADLWYGEDAVSIAERGVKNPDAFLINHDGHVTRVIESTGRYSLKQLESFHQHCLTAELPYELW